MPEASGSQSCLFCLTLVKFPITLMHHVPTLYITTPPIHHVPLQYLMYPPVHHKPSLYIMYPPCTSCNPPSTSRIPLYIKYPLLVHHLPALYIRYPPSTSRTCAVHHISLLYDKLTLSQQCALVPRRPVESRDATRGVWPAGRGRFSSPSHAH